MGRNQVPSEGFRKKCPVCGVTFITQEALRVYCSNYCREVVHNQKKNEKRRKNK